MAIKVPHGRRFVIVFVGNSITVRGWFDAEQSVDGGANLLMQQIAPRNSSLLVNNFKERNLLMANLTRQPWRGLTAINSGVNGNTIADIEANIAGRITDYNPDVVVLEAGINDAAAIPDPTPILDFRASYDNVLATVKATLPAVQIVCVGILTDGELWASAPPPAHFAGNPSPVGIDATIELFEAQIQESAGAAGAYYVPVRAPAALYESTHNTPEPGVASGILTVDGVHPNAAGQRLMSDAVAAVFS